jgi:putative sugar O-methyltransferase
MDNATRFQKYEAENKFNTSITDNGEYPELCDRICQDDNLFKNFRRNEIYTFALEHDSQEQGIQYLEIARKLKLFPDYIEDFKQNDEIGHPIVFSFPEIGEISPTTIRYIKILRDLEQEFGSLDDLNICEIGVGYGGLCRIIDRYFQVKSYCLVDLPSVLKLAKKFLSKFDINTALTYKTADELEITNKYDLVISNYAFTELRREIQDIYLHKVMFKSTRGYITYNYVNPVNFNSYTVEELTEIIPNLRVMQEIELTDPQDRILVWGES